ncbi:VWA domain-containing protein [Corynebacterium sp. ES2730-CONJ]|uniref:VWA domain-containing protein n=1 Tax=Corynebacterium sp. ES2730-CONJ TaxID=2973941 RepID=UPI00216AFA14|nr:VWA domain-containing protein [Corynebacterium sp. ES2730-CONJ]MCS4531597.1 VWA domain-containing protein [Corynebacterium sp. ES2730-CONJ]
MKNGLAVKVAVLVAAGSLIGVTSPVLGQQVTESVGGEAVLDEVVVSTSEPTPTSDSNAPELTTTEEITDEGETPPEEGEFVEPEDVDINEDSDEQVPSSDDDTQLEGARTVAGRVLPDSEVAIVRVRAGSDRLWDGQTASNAGASRFSKYFSPLAGVTLQVYRGNPRSQVSSMTKALSYGEPLRRVNEDWASCTTDFTGFCDIRIPVGRERGRIPTNERVWIKPVAVPIGYNLIDKVRTGPSDSGDRLSRLQSYAQLTPKLKAGVVIEAGDGSDKSETFMRAYESNWVRNYSITDSHRSSSGSFIIPKENPRLGKKCGLNFAIVGDLSGSVKRAGKTDDLSRAMIKLVNTMEGSGGNVSIFSLGSDSPAKPPYRLFGRPDIDNLPELYDLNDPSQTQKIKDQIREWGKYTDSNEGTNWDAGLMEVSKAQEGRTGGPIYDAVLFVTDGNPTTNRLPQYSEENNQGGSMTDFIRVEAAIASANRLKEQGTKIIGIGVGRGTTGLDGDSEYNLQSISGFTRYSDTANNADRSDYFLLSDYDEIPDTLRSIVSCSASVTVEKHILDENGQNPEAGVGWDIVGDATGPGVQLNSPRAQKTDADGLVFYRIGLEDTTSRAEVSVAEVQQSEWELVKQSDSAAQVRNALCYDSNDPQLQELPASRYSDDGEFGLRIRGIENGEHIRCVYQNKRTPSPAIVEIEKQDAQMQGLAGAVFMVATDSAGNSPVAGLETITEDPAGSGRYSFELKLGQYYLIETVSPSGYSLFPESVGFEVYKDPNDQTKKVRLLDEAKDGTVVTVDQNNTLKLVVMNVQSGTLPETGGQGLWSWLLTSLLLILGGIFLAKRRA